MLVEKDTMNRPADGYAGSGYVRPTALERRSTFMGRCRWRLQALALVGLYWWPVMALGKILGAARTSNWLGRLAAMSGPCLPRNRIVLRNLQLAFPEKNKHERHALARLAWEHIGRTAAELPLLPWLCGEDDRASERITIIGAEHLEAVAASKKGAVFISGHLANWEVMMLVICRRLADCLAVYRAANNPYIDRHLNRLRHRYGVRRLAPKGQATRALMGALAAGRSVALLNDQKFNEGLAIDFFGQPAMTAPGPASLALKYAAPIVPVSTHRRSPMGFTVEFHAPYLPQRTVDKAHDVRVCVEHISAFIEQQIRAHPAQWLWLHRRWPSGLY